MRIFYWLIPAVSAAGGDGSHSESVHRHCRQTRSRLQIRVEVSRWNPSLILSQRTLLWCCAGQPWRFSGGQLELRDLDCKQHLSETPHPSHCTASKPCLQHHKISFLGTFGFKVDYSTRKLAFSTALSRPCFLSAHPWTEYCA